MRAGRFEVILAVIAAGALSGCDDSPRAYRPMSVPPPATMAARPPAAPSPPPANPPSAGIPNYLAGDGGAARNALAGSGGNALAQGGNFGNGPKMPTQHSHWLRGTVSNAKVRVLLNNQLLGEFKSGMDKDITMRCRNGMNAILFEFEPLGPGASTHLEVLESEHSPPIAPLVTYQHVPAATTVTSSTRAGFGNDEDDENASVPAAPAAATAEHHRQMFYFNAQ